MARLPRINAPFTYLTWSGSTLRLFVLVRVQPGKGVRIKNGHPITTGNVQREFMLEVVSGGSNVFQSGGMDFSYYLYSEVPTSDIERVLIQTYDPTVNPNELMTIIVLSEIEHNTSLVENDKAAFYVPYCYLTNPQPSPSYKPYVMVALKNASEYVSDTDNVTIDDSELNTDAIAEIIIAPANIQLPITPIIKVPDDINSITFRDGFTNFKTVAVVKENNAVQTPRGKTFIRNKNSDIKPWRTYKNRTK